MRNGTQSRLTLVDGSGRKIQSDDDVSAEYESHEDESRQSSEAPVTDLLHNRALFVTISAACAAAAIAAASYAIWLTRQSAAQEAITSVQDLLDTCEQRMRQMEKDLNHLPHK